MPRTGREGEDLPAVPSGDAVFLQQQIVPVVVQQAQQPATMPSAAEEAALTRMRGSSDFAQ